MSDLTMPLTNANGERKRVYIIDDDSDIRCVIRALLEHGNPQWQVEDYGTAEHALAACELAEPHLIISDQVMPRTTGTELFDIVRQKYPETIRILISGHAATANKIASAQQFIAKPFDIQDLAETIERALAAQQALGNPDFARLVGSLTSFPALPKNCVKLLQELERDVNTENMNRLISEDGGILTRALQLANSPLFHGGATAKDAAAALRQLGTRNMRALVMSVHVFHGYERISLPEIDQTILWHHCCQTAAIAQQLAKSRVSRNDADDVFFAGLVHDLGRLILMENRREEYARACHQAIAQQTPLETVETQLFGKNNTELTSFMLQLWGMPESVCRAIINHVEPWRRAEEKAVTPAAILYVANHLSRQENPPDPFITPPLNQDYLRSVGFGDIS
jgi:HD-like signal output (HDOD) protein/CheY-like chemotaxis protein